MRHEHEWEPIPGQSGRYRCVDLYCLGMGYRGVVANINAETYRASLIFPYLCSQAGCEAAATWKGGLCLVHKREAKNKPAPRRRSVKLSAAALAFLRRLGAEGPLAESEVHPSTLRSLANQRLVWRPGGRVEITGTGKRVLQEYEAEP